MFERLGSFTFRFRYLVVTAWAAVAIGCLLFAPSLAKEGMTDQSKFLPATAPSVQARDALETAFPGSTSTTSATLSFSRPGGLTDADRAYIEGLASWLTGPDAPAVIRDAVTDVATADRRPELKAMFRSDDGELELMAVNLDVQTASGGAEAVTSAIRDEVARAAADHPGLAVHVTGSAAISSDYLAAIVKGTDSTTAVTVVLVIAILLLIYRAPLAAMVPLVTIGAAFLVSRGVLGILAAAGWQVSSLLDTFIVVLVFGVGTDYAIFLISRYREEVGHDNWLHAARVTVRRIGAVIAASAATVIVGLGSMAFADFGMIQTTGPALAIAVAVTLVAGLTLTPALLSIFGHHLFWPLHRGTAMGDPGGFFARLAAAVSRRPGIVTLVLLVALAIPATYIGSMRTNFDVLAELPSDSDARAGFDDIASHLGRGKVVQATGVVNAGPGVDVLSPASLTRLRDLSQDLVRADGVATVTSLVSPDGDGIVPDAMRPSTQLADMADGFAGSDSSSGTAATGEALLDPDVTSGLDTAREYLGLLGIAFPDVAVTTAYRTATERLDTARGDIEQARQGAVVATQLRTLSRSMISPAAVAGGGEGSDVAIPGDYLDELAARYPEVRTLAAFKDADRAAASLARKPSIGAALDLSTGLASLATWFDDQQPDATLFPESLAGTVEARQRRAEVAATFDAIPADLTALASVFAQRADDIFVPIGLSGDRGMELQDAVDAFVSGDRTATRFYVTTGDDPYAMGAFAGIRRAQDAVAADAAGFGPQARAYLGGATADLADVQTVLGRDFERVGMITVLGIFVVLVILLRAFVAPLYLVGTVLLSCATALGLSAWFFQQVRGDAGVSFYLPLMVFVLLVALGSDYNIFLMSRVREESENRPIRDGIRVASGRTGAVITSAGLILAGTFGSMASAPLAVLFQVGVAVAVGVLIDTFVVRSILVPAITTLAGDWAWWPFGAHRPGRRVAWPIVVAVPEAGWPASAASRSRRRLAVAIAMVALVPMVVAGLAVWSLSNPTANLARITAVVVNEDVGATMTASGGTAQPLRLGDDLAAGLVAGGGSDTFTWVRVADADEARDGLAEGRYGAVLTIPSDYSRTIAAIRAAAAGGEAAAGATPAKLRLTTNDADSYFLGTIARSISDTIALSAAEQVTTTYVDDVLLAVTTARDRVAGSAEGASGVAASSSDLAAGAGAVSGVTGELVAGLEDMAAGTSDASTGLDRLAAGIDNLAIGTRKIATGASKLADGADAAAAGGAGLATGVATLADGLDQMTGQVATLPAQTRDLATGAAGVSDGIDATATGLDALASNILAPLHNQTNGQLGSLAGSLDGLADDVKAGTGSVAGEAANGAGDARALADSAGHLTGSLAAYTGRIAALSADCATLGGSAELCSGLAAIDDDGPVLEAEAADLASDMGALARRLGDLAADAGSAAARAAALTAMTGPFAAQAPGIEAGIGQASSLAGQLAAGLTDPQATGSPSLQQAADLVEQGTGTLAQQSSLLSSSISDTASGAGRLAGAAKRLADGARQLAGGAGSLASGAALTADGAARVAGGTSDAADGATRLAGSVRDVVDAGRLVQAEADGLATDGRSVADDASHLASSLERDTTAIPSWSATDRETIGDVVSSPVTVESSRLNALATTGSGLAPYFMAIALWVGALATYLVLPAFLEPARRHRRWAGAVAGLLMGTGIGALQAVLMVAVLSLGVGIEVARLPELFAFAILVAAAAAAVTQALVALLGMRGWFVALAFLVLQLSAAGAWFPVATAPSLFGTLHPLLPMTYALEGFRTLIGGGSGSLGLAVLIQVAWIAGALGITLGVAAWRTRDGQSASAPVAA